MMMMIIRLMMIVIEHDRDVTRQEKTFHPEYTYFYKKEVDNKVVLDCSKS